MPIETFRSEYNGHPMLIIPMGEYKGEKKEFSFGLAKARAILETLDDIKAFVKEYDEGAPF